MTLPKYNEAIKEKIGKIYITGGGFVDREFNGIGTDSKYGWQEMVWKSTPSRGGTFAFTNMDDIDVGLIARCELNIKYMNIHDYMDLRKILGRERHFTVKFFDVDDGEWRTRDMYCSENQINKLYTLKQSLIGVLDYTIKLVGTNLDLETYINDGIETTELRKFNITYFNDDGSVNTIKQVKWGGNIYIGKGIVVIAPEGKHLKYWQDRLSQDERVGDYLPIQPETVWKDLNLYPVWSE